MVSYKFKFFDRKLKKYVSPFRGPKNVWEKRHELKLWGDWVVDIKKMAKLTKKDTNFDLYIKINFKNMIINYYKIMINKKGIQKGIQNY